MCRHTCSIDVPWVKVVFVDVLSEVMEDDENREIILYRDENDNSDNEEYMSDDGEKFIQIQKYLLKIRSPKI